MTDVIVEDLPDFGLSPVPVATPGRTPRPLNPANMPIQFKNKKVHMCSHCISSKWLIGRHTKSLCPHNSTESSTDVCRPFAQNSAYFPPVSRQCGECEISVQILLLGGYANTPCPGTRPPWYGPGTPTPAENKVESIGLLINTTASVFTHCHLPGTGAFPAFAGFPPGPTPPCTPVWGMTCPNKSITI